MKIYERILKYIKNKEVHYSIKTTSSATLYLINVLAGTLVGAGFFAGLGAAIGAIIGSFIPGAGTAVGAGVGAGLGVAAGLTIGAAAGAFLTKLLIANHLEPFIEKEIGDMTVEEFMKIVGDELKDSLNNLKNKLNHLQDRFKTLLTKENKDELSQQNELSEITIDINEKSLDSKTSDVELYASEIESDIEEDTNSELSNKESLKTSMNQTNLLKAFSVFNKNMEKNRFNNTENNEESREVIRKNLSLKR